MAKQVKQFRYYNEGNASKNTDGITKNDLVSANIFFNYPEITQLGIQTLPGVEFYLNNSIYSIQIGNTGIYELDVKGITSITNIHFDAESISMIDKSPTGYLIIDIIYEDEGV